MRLASLAWNVGAPTPWRADSGPVRPAARQAALCLPGCVVRGDRSGRALDSVVAWPGLKVRAGAREEADLGILIVALAAGVYLLVPEKGAARTVVPVR